MRRFRLVSPTRHRLATSMVSTADHCLLRLSLACQATLSLTSKDKSHHERTLVAQPHRKGTERHPIQTRYFNGLLLFLCSFSLLCFFSPTTLVSSHVVYFFPILWRIRRGGDIPTRKRPIELVALARSAMREIMFRTPPYPHRGDLRLDVAGGLPIDPRGARLLLIVPHLVDR
jgi:hypothetical protein